MTHPPGAIVSGKFLTVQVLFELPVGMTIEQAAPMLQRSVMVSCDALPLVRQVNVVQPAPGGPAAN